MNRMQKHNLYNIKRNIEKKTGTRLISAGSKEERAFAETAAPHKRIPRVALIAAIVTVFVTLTAFAVSIFSTWAGDSLTITASYYGDGIVWVEVTNQSDKELKLEPKMKLYYYSTQKLVESTDEEPYIDNLTIPAHSTEKVRLDLRRTYDIEALENSKNDFYYLQMTNDSFLLGQKWSCMVSFVVSDYVTPWYELSDESHLEGVLPSLQPYFKNFTPDIFARLPDAFDYLELVQAELAKVDGNIVRPSTPYLCFDAYDWMEGGPMSSFDGYNKLIGIDDTEDFDIIGVSVPRVLDNGEFNAGQVIPLFYLAKYAVSDIQSPQDYAFIRGNLMTFEEMEQYKVYEDEQYVVYEVHKLVYSDLRTYVMDMLLQMDDIYLDEEVWDRIERFYNHFADKEVMGSCFYYHPEEDRMTELLTMDDVISIAQKGENITYEDFFPYRGGLYSTNTYKHGNGYSFVIDGDYEMFYAMHVNGTMKGWYLIHNPSGDRIDIRYEDVEAFVKAHGEPLPRCSCEEVETDLNQSHGWTVTMDWLLEKGNSIVAGDFSYACNYWTSEGNKVESHFRYNPIHGTDDFYVMDCWSEENNKWMLWLVHTDSGDKCDLETEDATAFVNAHGGVE